MKNVILAVWLLTVFAACQPESNNQNHSTMKTENAINQAGAVEVTNFQLAPGATAAQLISSVKAMNENFLALQSGFIHRTLTQKNDSVWTDVIFWADELAAGSAMKAAEQSAEASAFMQLIDMPSVEFNLLKPQVAFEKK